MIFFKVEIIRDGPDSDFKLSSLIRTVCHFENRISGIRSAWPQVEELFCGFSKLNKGFVFFWLFLDQKNTQYPAGLL